MEHWTGKWSITCSHPFHRTVRHKHTHSLTHTYTSGMKVVSGNNKTHRKQAKIISSMANFHETADFPSTGLALSGNHGENTGSQVSAFLVVPLLSPSPNSFLIGFYVLATSNVIRMGFETLNCCQLYLAFLVFWLMLVDKC